MSLREEIRAAFIREGGLTCKELVEHCPSANGDRRLVSIAIAALRTELKVKGIGLEQGEPVYDIHEWDENDDETESATEQASAGASSASGDSSSSTPTPQTSRPSAPARAVVQQPGDNAMDVREKIRKALQKLGEPSGPKAIAIEAGLEAAVVGYHLRAMESDKELKASGNRRSRVYALPGQKKIDEPAPRTKTPKAEKAQRAGNGHPPPCAERQRARAVRDKRAGRARHRARGPEAAPGHRVVRAPALLHRAHEAGLGSGVKRKAWTALDEAELRELYPHVRTADLARALGRRTGHVYARAKLLGVKKSPEYLASPDACRRRRGDNVGMSYRYLKGHVPANKGMRRPGWAPGRMAVTQFKKGAENHNVMPIGSERMVDGYRYIKVAAVRYVPYTVNWLPLHILNWEQANGMPLPAKHCLWFRDGNRLNVEASNLELITRAENMARNTLHRYPKPIVRAIQLRGALNRRINKMERDHGHQHA